jgi:fatty acid CoA ligase FadD36
VQPHLPGEFGSIDGTVVFANQPKHSLALLVAWPSLGTIQAMPVAGLHVPTPVFAEYYSLILAARCRQRQRTGLALTPGSLAGVLLTSLNPDVDFGAHDIADAIRIADSVLSRSDLAGAATAVAERVGGAGRVAVLATPTASTVLAITGCLIAGVPAVPVPADVGTAERAHILRDSAAQAWLGEQPDDLSGLPHIPVRLSARSAHRHREPPADDPALVIYTSGTTGPPKGVQLSRRALAADLDALAAAWQWTPDDVLVHGLPLYHVHGLVLGLLGSLRFGNRFVHTGKPTAAGYAQARIQAGGTLYFGVPTVWSRVVADATAARVLRAARLLVSGSAPLPVPVFSRLAELTGHPPIERYGSTESLITLSTRADGERRPGWVGLPLHGVQTRLVDEDGALASHDGETIARLQVRGSTLFDGPEPTGCHRRGFRCRRLVSNR